MLASKLGIRLIALLTATTFVTLAGCAAETTGDEEGEETGATSEDALTAAGGRTLVYFLGSSSFLRQCAGNTLGCGRAVASVADSTPYFSAPRTWSRSTCNQWFTFKANGKCVEAQRFEVSDRRNYIEANPGLMKGLGLRYSDGTRCAGSGQGTATVTPGRHCGTSSASTQPANPTDPTPSTPADNDPSEDPGDGGCFSSTLNRAVPEKTCVQSRSSSVWMQCNDRQWFRGVEGATGPYGACLTRHPLP